MNKNILIRIANIANELDNNDLINEANIVTDVMNRVAQYYNVTDTAAQINNIINQAGFSTARTMEELNNKFNKLLSQYPDLFRNPSNRQYLNSNYNINKARFTQFGTEQQKMWADTQKDMQAQQRELGRETDPQKLYQQEIQKYKDALQRGDEALAKSIYDFNAKGMSPLSLAQKQAFIAQAYRIRLELGKVKEQQQRIMYKGQAAAPVGQSPLQKPSV